MIVLFRRYLKVSGASKSPAANRKAPHVLTGYKLSIVCCTTSYFGAFFLQQDSLKQLMGKETVPVLEYFLYETLRQT